MNPSKPESTKNVENLSDDELEPLVRRSLALPDAPPWLVQRAIDLWRRSPSDSLTDRVQAAFARVAAVLTFDSWTATPLALGMRSLSSDARHLLFSAQGRDVDLRISPTANHFRVSGQVLGPDTGGVAELALRDAGAEKDARASTLDSLGEFHLEGLVPGTYVLTFHLTGTELVLPPFDVGERKG